MKEIKVTTKEEKRINAFLRDEGIASRRHADDYIEKGYVLINGKRATLGSKVSKGDVSQVSAPKKDLI